jgi:NAD(P)-dependent dehydrogenase (short-subunit alcohol dehydrogenase family)
MVRDLSGKTALVTGSTSGIGRAAAEALAELGAQVAVSGRDEARGGEVVAAIRDRGGRAHFVAADLTSAAGALGLAGRATAALGGTVDVLVNNAGIYPPGSTPQTDEPTFDTTYALNVKAPYFLTGALAPPMAERGYGAIVNVSTMAAHYGEPGLGLYGSSKAALELLTRAWAAEFGPRGVRVNAVVPGPTRTAGTSVMADAVEHLAATTIAGRLASPEEIAAAIAFLASDEASYIQGAIVAVDGGRTAI